MQPRIGPWFREGSLLYLLVNAPSLVPRGPILRANKFSITISKDRHTPDDQHEALVISILDFLNKEADATRPLSDLEEDAYSAGGPKSGQPRRDQELLADVHHEDLIK